MRSERIQYFIYLLPLIIVIIYFNWQSSNFIIHDFANYYFGAKAVLNGSFTPNIYDALHFNKLFDNTGINNLFVNYYPNSPFISFAFIPLTAFDWQTAKLIHNIIGSIFFVISIYRISIFYNLPKWSFLLITFLFVTAIKNNILFGQSYFYIFFLLSEGLICYKKNKGTLASLFWSLAILIKIFPVVIFFWLFFKRDLLTFLKLGFFCVLLIVISVPTIGIDIWSYFAFEAFPLSSSGLIYDGFTVRAKSAIMLFKNVFIKDALLNASPLIESTFLFMVSYIFYKAVLFSAAASATNYRSEKTLFTFSVWILAGLLIAPTSSSYSKLMLIFPMLYLLSLDKEHIKGYAYFLILCLTLFLNNFPTQHLYDLPLPLNFLKLILLFVLFFLFIRSVHFNWSWMITLSFLGLFTVQSIMNPVTSSQYDYLVLDDKSPTIMSKIDFKDGFLHYHYLGLEGETIMKTDLEINDFTTENLKIDENQIFYKNEQLTHSKDRKLTPYLINQSTIIFLSDSGRAPGCYTIRKINI